MLEALSIGAAKVPEHQRWLTCGRVAHPAAMPTIAVNPMIVPKPGLRPTPWQQETGQAIASAYGAHAFDPETFICVGSGEPIGYPIIEVEVQAEAMIRSHQLCSLVCTGTDSGLAGTEPRTTFGCSWPELHGSQSR